MASRRPGGLEHRGQADADGWFVGASLGRFLPPPFVIRQFQSPVQTVAVFSRVVGGAGDGLVGEGFRRDEVLFADIGRVHSQVLGDQVKGAFQAESRLGTPSAPESAGGGLVGHGGGKFHADRRDDVGTVDAPHRVEYGRRGG